VELGTSRKSSVLDRTHPLQNINKLKYQNRETQEESHHLERFRSHPSHRFCQIKQ